MVSSSLFSDAFCCAPVEKRHSVVDASADDARRRLTLSLHQQQSSPAHLPAHSLSRLIVITCGCSRATDAVVAAVVVNYVNSFPSSNTSYLSSYVCLSAPFYLYVSSSSRALKIFRELQTDGEVEGGKERRRLRSKKWSKEESKEERGREGMDEILDVRIGTVNWSVAKVGRNQSIESSFGFLSAIWPSSTLRSVLSTIEFTNYYPDISPSVTFSTLPMTVLKTVIANTAWIVYYDEKIHLIISVFIICYSNGCINYHAVLMCIDVYNSFSCTRCIHIMNFRISSVVFE